MEQGVQSNDRARLFGNLALFVSSYLIMTGVMMVANEALGIRTELPWTWYWLIWGVVFSPAVVTGIFMLASVDLQPRRLAASCAVSLIMTAAIIETLFIQDARPTATAVGVVLACGLT